jgi:hypothetical protein
MAGAVSNGRPKLKLMTLSVISLLLAKNGLDFGVHFLSWLRFGEITTIPPRVPVP